MDKEITVWYNITGEAPRRTQVLHHGQREDDPHSDNNDEVVSVHEPLTASRMETHSKFYHQSTVPAQTLHLFQAC